MGQSNSRCNCCNSNDKDEVKFEQKENGGNNSENPPLSNKVESVRDLKSYVTFKKLSDNDINEYIQIVIIMVRLISMMII